MEIVVGLGSCAFLENKKLSIELITIEILSRCKIENRCVRSNQNNGEGCSNQNNMEDRKHSVVVEFGTLAYLLTLKNIDARECA